MKNVLILAFFIIFALLGTQAQTLSFNYRYQFEPVLADEPPQFNGVPNFDFPEAARKNGVEGTLKASLTLGEDGKVRDLVIHQSLPDGVTEAFTKAAQKREQDINTTFKRAGVDVLSLSTEDDLVKSILRFANLRKERKAHPAKVF